MASVEKQLKNMALEEPEYIQYRIAMFEQLQKEYKEFIAAQPRKTITVTLPDGSTREATSWETTPMDIAVSISKGLADRTVISKVNDQLWDLTRPLEDSCTLKLLDFNDPEGKRVFWHSSAHILGEASELHFGCHLCIGPPTTDGFFYEMAIDDNKTVTTEDYPALEALAKNAIKQKQPFERLIVSKENLLKMFKHNKYKQHIIESKIPDGTSTTVYRCGPLIDLCVGPHVPHTGRVKAFAVMKNSSSYFLGDAKNDSLQRIYGVSFPDNKQMSEYKKFLAEAAKRDHRKIGREQDLFFFHELSPGSCFFLPHGARIYNQLIAWIREQYKIRGFQEVITPNMYNVDLWKTSGHWNNYAENMFSFEIEKDKFALKPMNCPGHCLIYKSRDRSYRDLPWRCADFGVLHRNEFSGALTGLTRVRRFQQDDAHIFCRPDQVRSEIENCFDFLKYVYGVFGFTFHLELSTRPEEKYLGDLETWNKAEAQLKAALDASGYEWELNEGDGAFYGPKIDITVFDALKRQHQCATIQLDFQLPERFELEFHGTTEGDEAADSTNKNKYIRPVMIHRAILGSVERMIAILTEHYGGKWPFWLSPRQVSVVPVSAAAFDYANKVQKRLFDAGLFADVDTSDNTLPKKIRNAQLSQYNFIFVVGAEEEKTNSVNIRNRDDPKKQAKTATVPLDEVVAKLVALKETKNPVNQI
ncbi:cytoplasmic threonine-tRNA ligase Trs1 [Schizosaccharomyces japonicus yFS275]|uniref:Threonine--tRNA ligase, cytoplasmic n=1 Tax=Schizosaccharomyces japonicus (strain yFS275 / FY16936) TaxID=402676 RepID=B6K047_SCHJY|nr:cytoplasmic threonine-tRNA ligase Trs1 [Schizosaccharomyces japonicus yFS275]EEB06197.1 cytoplasmic threonine-tRNA ligase Trs1 [Schizosaccharomyces japonicus yFS275]